MPSDKRWRFEHLADKIRYAIFMEGLSKKVEVIEDQYNNFIRVNYESTEQWDEKTERWRVWNEDEDRWEDEEPKPKIVKWPIYAHRSKDANYEAALDAGLTDEEIDKNPDLIYVGYEISGTVTFNRETGEFKVEWHGD